MPARNKERCRESRAVAALWDATRNGRNMAMEEFETTAIDGVLLGPIVWALRYSTGEVYLREVETSSISA